jgi:hypothetical protein
VPSLLGEEVEDQTRVLLSERAGAINCVTFPVTHEERARERERESIERERERERERIERVRDRQQR